MAKKVKKKVKKKAGPTKGIAYFSTRSLERAVSKGTKNKASIARQIVGYTVKEVDGWIVKEHAGGKVERISKIKKTKRPSRLALD